MGEWDRFGTSHARHHLRFHLPHVHLFTAFGHNWFGVKPEAFARFFGTPVFLIGQRKLVDGDEQHR
jgi:hypothetical protein